MKAASSKESALIWHENEEPLLLDECSRPTRLKLSPAPPSPPLAQLIPEGERFFFTNSSREKFERNELDEKFTNVWHALEINNRAGKIMSNTVRFIEHSQE